MKRSTLTAGALATFAATALVGCSAGNAPAPAPSATPTPTATSATSAESTLSGKEALDKATTDLQADGKEMLSKDSELNGLVADWEEITKEDCAPQSADFKTQRSAVFCGDSNILATFDSPEQQEKYKKEYMTLKGSGPGPEWVVDGDGWSAYAPFNTVVSLVVSREGQISNLSDNQAASSAAAASSMTGGVAGEIKPVNRPVEISCGVYPRAQEYASVADVWATPPKDWGSCYVAPRADIRAESALEKKSLEISEANWGDSIPDADARKRMLQESYSMCASKNMSLDAEELSIKSNKESAKAAIVLCPEHPDMDSVKALMREGDNITQLKEEGRVIEPGTHKVGKDVQPGTYVAESETPMDGCYWEARDSAGEIIDNEFATSAYRMEMTIPEDAYSVMTKRCEDFYPAN